jgi:hypothetical protein
VTGNDRDAARVGGRAKIRVRGPFGVRLDETGNLAVPELLPGAQITLTERIAGVPPAGRLGAAVTLNSVAAEGALPTASRTGSVWARAGCRWSGCSSSLRWRPPPSWCGGAGARPPATTGRTPGRGDRRRIRAAGRSPH